MWWGVEFIRINVMNQENKHSRTHCDVPTDQSINQCQKHNLPNYSVFSTDILKTLYQGVNATLGKQNYTKHSVFQEVLEMLNDTKFNRFF